MMVFFLLLITLLLMLWFLAHYNFWRPKVDRSRPRVLMYHSISEDDGDLAVSPDHFERQLIWLTRHGYRFCCISELVSEPNSGNEKRVALTFDDGFKDNYTEMFPLLNKYNAKATIYLAPDIEGIEKLSVSDIQEMQASGRIEFGAHTMSHVNLSTLDESEALHEIQASKTWVENVTNEACDAFAYPFGRFNDTNVKQVSLLGFTTAVTVKKGIEQISDPFRIKRISVLGKTNILQFSIAMSRGRYRV